MCGIFGAAKISDFATSPFRQDRALIKLAKLSESRGKDGAGLLIVDPHQQNSIQVFKGAKKMTSLLRGLSQDESFQNRLAFAPLIFGHTRLTTHGSSDDHQAIQPVQCGEIWATHNGIILNHKELQNEYGMKSSSFHSDSHSFFSLLDRVSKNEPFDFSKMVELLSKVRGTASCSFYHAQQKALYLYTNHGSLFFLRSNKSGQIYWASEAAFLKKMASSLKEDFEVVESRPNEIHWFQWNDKNKTFQLQIVEVLPSKKKNSTDSTFGPVAFNFPATTLNSGRLKKIEQQMNVLRNRVGKITRCQKCVLPATTPFISFNETGVCSFCLTYSARPTLGRTALESKLRASTTKASIPKTLLGFSGGRDSSFALHYLVKEFGLKPTTYTYEWGMVTDISRRNIARMCGELEVENITISADIGWKRKNIRDNIVAWLKQPHLGMVPLFMAGDKPFFSYIHRLSRELQTDVNFLAINHLENAQFKEDFAGFQYWKPGEVGQITGPDLPIWSRLRLPTFYAGQFLKNSSYWNQSLIDSFWGYLSYYFFSTNYLDLFRYIHWDETNLDQTLISQYGWEHFPNCTTWRIGDGSTPFYNFIYYTMAGLTENDTLRSNQIREGSMTREVGLRLTERDNLLDWERMAWYFNAIDLDMFDVLETVLKFPQSYE